MKSQFKCRTSDNILEYLLFKLAWSVSLTILFACTSNNSASINSDIRSRSSSPNTYFLDRSSLSDLKLRIAKGLAAKELSVARKIGNKALDCGPLSVTRKSGIPPSGDKHDFMSLAPYWWPNPNTRNHLPYLRKDGQVNPQTKEFGDEAVFQKLSTCVQDLSVAAYLSNNQEFGNAGARLIKGWFLDQETRMNPNLRYSEGIIGRTSGRGVGTNVGREFLLIIDSIQLLEAGNYLSSQDMLSLKNWFLEYLTWLQTSNEGKEAAIEEGNIATIYFAQVVTAAVFVGNKKLARNTIEKAFPDLIRLNIEPDGSQPHELSRTRSWNYSHTSLRHFFYLAMLGDELGIEPRLWYYQSKDGRSMLKALKFLIPYGMSEKKWPYKQIDRFDPQRIAPFLTRASKIYGDETFANAAQRVSVGISDEDRLFVSLGSLKPVN